MTLDQSAPRTAYRPLAILLVCVAVVALTLVWTYRAMRAVMEVGGSCASGGPYEIAQPCPDGAWLISLAIPVLVIAAMLGSFLAVRAAAPTLILPMWAVLFGALGWNFLEYGFADDGLVWGFIVCGVLFELMALPALVVMVAGDRFSLVPRMAAPSAGQGTWYAAYAVLGAVGAAIGWWSFDAIG